MDLQFKTLVFLLRNVNGFSEYCFSEDCSEYLKEHDVLLNFDKCEDIWSQLFMVNDWA